MSAKANARKSRRRNASRARFLPRPTDPPDLKDVAAAVVGGGGTAALGAWLANKGADPTLVGLGLGVAGGMAALLLPKDQRRWRVAASGVSAAGASQLALALMHKQAVEKVKEMIASADAKPSNAAFSGGGDGFGRQQRLAARTIDDEERLTDPDLELDAA